MLQRNGAISLIKLDMTYVGGAGRCENGNEYLFTKKNANWEWRKRRCLSRDCDPHLRRCDMCVQGYVLGARGGSCAFVQMYGRVLVRVFGCALVRSYVRVRMRVQGAGFRERWLRGPRPGRSRRRGSGASLRAAAATAAPRRRRCAAAVRAPHTRARSGSCRAQAAPCEAQSGPPSPARAPASAAQAASG
eukprot:4020829-Pleurochrysis_carterae.AAC.1